MTGCLASMIVSELLVCLVSGPEEGLGLPELELLLQVTMWVLGTKPSATTR